MPLLSSDLLDLAQRVGAHLHAQGWKLATAESCTGGLVAAAMTQVAGSSQWVECGFVTYSNEAKVRMLGVSEATLAAHGAVSERTVREMVRGAMWPNSGAQVAVAISGIAGPSGGSAEKPVGTVCMAWGCSEAKTDGQVQPRIDTCTQLFAGSREAVREAAARFVLEQVLTLHK